MVDLFIQPMVVCFSHSSFLHVTQSLSFTYPSKSCQYCLAKACDLCATSDFYMILCPRCQPWLFWETVNHNSRLTHVSVTAIKVILKTSLPLLHKVFGGGVQITVHLRHSNGSGLGWFPLRLSPFYCCLAHTPCPDSALQEKTSALAGFADCLT